MTRIAITGYASLDYIVQLEASPRAHETVRIVHRPAEWPRPGGSPAYVGAAAAAAGLAAQAVSWVGDDDAAETYLRALQARGIDTSGIARLPGRTPACILAYRPDGACYCQYDAGFGGTAVLGEAQRALLAQAEMVCLTIGPRAVSEAALRDIGEQRFLAWSVKNDRTAMPAYLAERLAGRADLIAYSRSERAFLLPALQAAGPRRGRIVVETQDQDGALVAWDGRSEQVPAEKIAAPDPTGAGDTFLGGMLAALAVTPDDPPAAARAGAAAAARLLAGRAAA